MLFFPTTSNIPPCAPDDAKTVSAALGKVGFARVGPTICYALMQSVEMVYDHM